MSLGRRLTWRCLAIRRRGRGVAGLRRGRPELGRFEGLELCLGPAVSLFSGGADFPEVWHFLARSPDF